MSSWLTTYIATNGSAQTREDDDLSWAINFAPQALTMYVRFYEFHRVQHESDTTALLMLGDSTSTTPSPPQSSVRLDRPADSNNYRISHSGPLVSVTSNIGTTQTRYNDLIELVGQLYADGSVQAHISVNGAVTSGTQTSATPIGTQWNTSGVLQVGQRASSAGSGAMGLTHIAVWRGVLSLEKMREKARVITR